MTTAADWLSATEGRLLSGQRQEMDKLAAGVDDTTDTLTVAYENAGIRPGARLAVGLEEMYVWAVAGASVTVERGWNGSAASTHADGSVVHVNPRWSRWEIFRALNDDLRSLSSPANGLFRVAVVDVTYNPVRSGYDLAGVSSIDDVIDVRYETLGPSNEWPVVPAWDWQPAMPTDDFPSGVALFTRYGEPGRRLRIRYRRPYGTLVSLGDDIEATTGLHAEAHDIPPMGAAEQLAGSAEIKRNFTEVQHDTRRLEQVPPGARLRSSLQPAGARQRRIAEEAARLSARYPRRRGW